MTQIPWNVMFLKNIFLKNKVSRDVFELSKQTFNTVAATEEYQIACRDIMHDI